MSIFKEIPVTAGFPIKREDIAAIFDSKIDPVSIEEDFRHYLNVNYAAVVYSGTTSLYFILETIKLLTKKRTVLIPSYTCPLVPLAIKRAGFNMAICDITGYDFNYDISELEGMCSYNKDIAAVLAVHLAGIPVDFDSIENIAKKYAIYTIEDCALSLGADYKGKKAGSLGDFSFFSLCRGKGVTMYEGGVIVTNTGEYGRLLNGTIKRLEKEKKFPEALKIIELLGYGIIYRPEAFWFAYKLPEIFWNILRRPFKAGGEEYGLDFPTHRVSTLRKKVGHSMFLRLDKEALKQREKAAYYIEALKNSKGVKILTEPSYARSNYPYVTLLYDDNKKNSEVRKKLFSAGLGVSDVYSLPINEYGFLKGIMPAKDCPNARRIALTNLTLSTSEFMGRRDMDEVIEVIRGPRGISRPQ